MNIRTIWHKPTSRNVLAGSLYALVCIAAGASSLESNDVDPRNSQLGQQWDLATDPHKVMGVQSCEKCHTSEVNIWKQTPHSTTYLTLHRKAEAQQIARKLNIASFKSDSNCIQCHYTMQQQDDRLHAISGVSCESCHGAAADYISIHNDYGSGATRQSEGREHRRDRLLTSIKAGMRNPVNVYMVAQSCLRCHTVPDEKLVNVGGHSAGSLDFELVSWSQGSVKHRFLDSANGDNKEAAPERLRLLFVAGLIADMEHSMRATALATEKATFGITSAQRTARAAKRLEAAQSKLNNEILAAVLEVFGSVKLRLNNQAELVEAADKIQRLGIRFAAVTRGEDLVAIEAYIPPPSVWK